MTCCDQALDKRDIRFANKRHERRVKTNERFARVKIREGKSKAKRGG
jgi:hypothetical protein